MLMVCVRVTESDVSMNGESKSSSGKKKKSVRWVEESRLKIFHYFELDEDERSTYSTVAIETRVFSIL
jgi:hypothetical protein